MGRFCLGHIPIDPVSAEEALDRIAGLVAAGDGRHRLHAECRSLLLAEENRAFRDAYGEASLSLVDGMPVLWAARLLGYRVPQKLSGWSSSPSAARRVSCGPARCDPLSSRPSSSRLAQPSTS